MSNYPPGTWSGDPSAPWNQPDMPNFNSTKMGVCDHCENENCSEGEMQWLNGQGLCETCFIDDQENNQIDEEQEKV